MTKPADYCDQCAHYKATVERPRDVCAIGHRPRFYIPKTLGEAHGGSWGWKKRCIDFQRAGGQV